MIKSAILSKNRKHRYLLSRIWDLNNENILFIMLNPSSADEDIDDATTTKVILKKAALHWRSLENSCLKTVYFKVLENARFAGII